MRSSLPSVSVLIPTLNEENYIQECIESLINGISTLETYEIFVIDGGSTDKTLEITRDLQMKDSRIKILENRNKIVASAVNLGVKHAKYEYIIWCGAHAIYENGYIEKSLEVHQQVECSSSGGVIEPISKTFLGSLIAICTKSKFSGGGADYRHADERTEASSVFGGCFKKEVFLAVGGFNTQWVRNQDLEFNSRLRKQVGPIIVDPAIRCKYYCRDSLNGLSKQYFQYGYWRYITSRLHPMSFKLRLLAPPILVASSFALILMSIGYSTIYLLPILAYLVMCLMAAVIEAKRNNDLSPTSVVIMTIIFANIHYSWGLGFLTSLTKEQSLTQRFKPANKP